MRLGVAAAFSFFLLLPAVNLRPQDQQSQPAAVPSGTAQESSSSSTAAPAPPSGHIPRVGIVHQAKILHSVPPRYPPEAKRQHISGTVVLRAVIAKDGSITKLAYVSGPSALVNAATDAVRQWKYAPTFLDGKPIEVATTISVYFNLNGNAS